MSRGVAAANTAAAAAEVFRPVWFLELEFDGGTTRYCGWPTDITWGGNTWTGAGNLGSLSVIDERTDLQAERIMARLSGINSALVSVALQEHVQGRDAAVYLGLMDAAHALVATPHQVFSGRMNTMQMVDIGATATIELAIDGRLADWQRPRVRRYTNADQQNRFADDKGFEFVSQMVEKSIVWGR